MNIAEDSVRSRPESDSEDPPPFARSWNRLYIAVVIYTCVLILALYLMTVTLNR